MKKKMMMMMVGVLSSGMAFGVGDLKTAWETGKRAETLDWFRREMFGYAPPRPADETFDDEGVSFAGGKIKIRVHRALPKGACAENPAPVFLLLDHYNGAERTDGLWHRPGTPTNSITARGYAYVNASEPTPCHLAASSGSGRWASTAQLSSGPIASNVP